MRRLVALVITTRSSTGLIETRRRLTDAITDRGLTVFARIDHAAAAREAGLELQPEEVVLFGNPRAGTPLMQADPRVGLELPLRMLVWEASEGVMVGYSDPLELAREYDVGEQRETLEQMSQLLAALARETSA